MKIIFILSILVLFHKNVLADCNVEPDKVSLFYINGMFTNEASLEDNTYELARFYNLNLSSLNVSG